MSPSSSTEMPLDSVHAPRRGRVIATLWALFFALMLVLEVQEHWENPYIRWWEPIVWIASSALVATGLLWLHLLDRPRAARYLDQPLRWFWRQIRWFPLAAVVFIVAIYFLRHLAYTLIGVPYRHESWGFVFLYETLKLWLFLGLWLGILFAIEWFAHGQEQRRRLEALQRSLAEARLQQLKAQLRPHFLFNALNTISSLMQVDVTRADRLLRQLADLLRASLRSDREELGRFSDELKILRLYCEIMEQRFEGRVSVEWSIAPDVGDAQAPTMLLQPLLENAFKYGVEDAVTPARISIAARRVDSSLEVTIRNTIAGSPPPGDGVGLQNCRARIQAHYGERGRLKFAASTEEAQVDVVLPYEAVAA
jgi:two-component system LytT family sensor kinase